jgi:hypothetical protein
MPPCYGAKFTSQSIKKIIKQLKSKIMTTTKSALKSIAILALSSVMLLASCKKDKGGTVLECFNDSYNGSYTGSGVVGSNPGFSGVLTLTKKGCQEAEIRVGTVTENVTGLKASAGGGFTGTTSTGASASMTLTNNKDISVSVGTTVNFSGSK